MILKLPIMSTSKITHGPAALENFRAKGWTFRTAASRLDVSVTHLHEVLHGRRHSRRLLQRISALPLRKDGAA